MHGAHAARSRVSVNFRKFTGYSSCNRVPVQVLLVWNIDRPGSGNLTIETVWYDLDGLTSRFRGVLHTAVASACVHVQQLYNMRRVRRTVRAYIQRMQLHYSCVY